MDKTFYIRKIVIMAIRTYQMGISPFLGARCRFYPSCSDYAIQAISVYGILRGGRLALRRLLRCHPFCQGGYDPIPSCVSIENIKEHEL